jgi:hypothetical protein
MMPQHVPDIRNLVCISRVPSVLVQAAPRKKNKEDQVTLIRQRHS